jgi:hypothetical protein
MMLFEAHRRGHRLPLAPQVRLNRRKVDRIGATSTAAGAFMSRTPSWCSKNGERLCQAARRIVGADRKQMPLRRMLLGFLVLAAVAIATAAASPRLPITGPLVEYSVRFDGTNRLQIGRTGPVLNQDELFTISWSPDGRWFAYIDSDRKSVYTASAEPLTSAPPLQVTVPMPGYVGSNPAFSPDGGTIAFTIGVLPSNAKKLYLVGRDGSKLRELTSRGHTPSWSGDGRWLTFTADTISDTKVMLVRADGKALRTLAAGHAAVFAPRGGLIAFLSKPSRHSLELIDRNGTGVRVITTAFVPTLRPVIWSADASRLAWTGPGGLETVTLGGGARTIAAGRWGRTLLIPLAFSPRGSQIAYLKDGNLYTVSTRGGRPRFVTSTRVSVDGIRWTSETRLTYLTIRDS